MADVMTGVALWVKIDGQWRHGTTSDDVMAVELVGVGIAGHGLAEVMITEADEHPDEIEYVVVEYGDAT